MHGKILSVFNGLVADATRVLPIYECIENPISSSDQFKLLGIDKKITGNMCSANPKWLTLFQNSAKDAVEYKIPRS